LPDAGIERVFAASLRKRVRPPGVELAHPVEVPLPGSQGQPKLADREQILIAVPAFLYIVKANTSALVGEAIGGLALDGGRPFS